MDFAIYLDKGFYKWGRTMCFNLGSEYGEGTLRVDCPFERAVTLVQTAVYLWLSIWILKRKGAKG